MSNQDSAMDRPMPFVRATFHAVVATMAVLLILSVVAIGVGLGVGYRPVIITTGSMTPTAPTGSLLIAGPADRVGPGDILVMRRDGRATVTHRIIEVEYNADGDPYAVTRGDANAEIDAAPYAIGDRELTGRWVVPGFGRVLLAMGSPLVAVTVVSVAVAVVALGVLRRIWALPGTGANGGRSTSGGRKKRSKRVRMAGASMFLGVTMAGTGVAWSLYLGVASVGSNVFATAECFDARLAGVQKGTTVNSAAGTQAFAIAPVDPTRSFLQISARSASNEPADSQLMARLVDASTIELTRQTDDGSPPAITIEWSVVEYACGVSVQRGVSAGDGSAQVDTTISPVDTTSSFVLSSATTDPTASDFDGDDLTIVELSNSSTVRVRTSGAPLPTSQQTAWQVVTFDDPGDATTQIVAGTLGAGTGTATVALATPVDTRATFVLAQLTSTSTGSEIGERLVRVRLLDSSTVEVSRLVPSEAVDFQVQVIELTDGTTVRRGVIDLGSGQTSASVTIPPVDPSRSTVASTVMLPGSSSGGATDHIADDVVGEASATAVLSDAATVTLERGVSASNASFAWQAITWGGPEWADPLTPFRQRIDITAGGVDAPNGYTTPLTFDHASLVSTGLALPGGDDARIWRYDGTSWTELDRVLDETSSWNTGTTTVWFRTQESITANDRISYWLYFGNPTPPPPRDDPSNVWLLREGFEDGTLGFFEDRTGGSGWYRAEPWTRRQQLTIDSATVSSPLTDQPVLVRVTDPDLTTYAQADGSDFRFTAADGMTPLPHEVEEWNPATDTLTAWVRLPFLSASTDTGLYLYYGATDAPNQADGHLTWAGDIASWNMAADPAGAAPTLNDSGPGNHDGLALADTAGASTTSGRAVVLDGSTDRLEAAPFDIPTEAFTVAAWFRADGLGTNPVIAAQGDPANTGVFELGIDTETTPGSPVARLVVRVDGSAIAVSGGSITVGAWHHVVGTFDGSNLRLHLDGTLAATATAPGQTPNGSNVPVVLGGNPDGTRTMEGLLGQVRLDDMAWTPARVSFAYSNLQNPGATVAAGAASGGSWFDQGDWSVRRPLAVDADRVDAPLADFPLLVQLVDPNLATNAQFDGDDLVFVAADGVTRLDHHIESWDDATGALTAWVRIPALDNVNDGELFLYLGNPSARDQTDPRAVFGPDSDLVLNGQTR